MPPKCRFLTIDIYTFSRNSDVTLSTESAVSYNEF